MVRRAWHATALTSWDPLLGEGYSLPGSPSSSVENFFGYAHTHRFMLGAFGYSLGRQARAILYRASLPEAIPSKDLRTCREAVYP
jgi:hypothetical protein